MLTPASGREGNTDKALFQPGGLVPRAGSVTSGVLAEMTTRQSGVAASQVLNLSNNPS
jgi:hypothetical protein